MDNVPAYTTCQCDDKKINTDIIDPINALIADSCYGKMPIIPSYCNENKLFHNLFAMNLSSVLATEQTGGKTLHNDCTVSQVELANTDSCILTSYCQDQTCSDCKCFNTSLNSWYGEVFSHSNVSIVIWYNNEVGLSKQTMIVLRIVSIALSYCTSNSLHIPQSILEEGFCQLLHNREKLPIATKSC